MARALIGAARVPLAAPSANVSGRPSPTCAQHVADDLGDVASLAFIVDAGACELAKAVRCNTVLTALGVPSNGISNQGAAELASALRENNTLIQMGLSANNIGDEGAKCFINLLETKKALTSLYLSDCNISETMELQLRKANEERGDHMLKGLNGLVL